MSDTRFHFGKNWQAYLSGHFSEQSLARSVESLQKFLPVDLSGKTFLDAGCGSGVHSLAALRLGAKSIMSFDFDEDAVEGTQKLKEKMAPDSDWIIKQGSLLDADFLRNVGTYDVVYCWGVAHHTGDMWEALGNLYEAVAPGGHLFVSIYNTVDGRMGSRWWYRVKRFYNNSSWLVKKALELGYISYNVAKLLIRMKNPFRIMREYERKRGMSWTVDLIDWLGGYPYEHARPDEVFSFYREKFGMELVALKTTQYIGCNQFVFVRK